MQVVVLAAGQGTRLGTLTQGRSKAMLPVVGIPMVARALAPLLTIGATEVILVVSPEDEEIRAHFADSAHGPLPVRLVDQVYPLGTADALQQAAVWIQGDFILTACDNLVSQASVDRLLARWSLTPPLDALLSLLPVRPEMVASTAVVTMDGQVVRSIVEKPALGEAPSLIASLPLYVFSKAILSYLSDVGPSVRGERELTTAIQALIDAGGKVGGIRLTSRQTLTVPADLLKINLSTLAQTPDLRVGLPTRAGAGLVLTPPYFLETGIEVGERVTLGPRVFIEAGCRLGDGVHVRDAVLLKRTVLPPGRTVVQQLVTDLSL